MITVHSRFWEHFGTIQTLSFAGCVCSFEDNAGMTKSCTEFHMNCKVMDLTLTIVLEPYLRNSLVQFRSVDLYKWHLIDLKMRGS